MPPVNATSLASSTRIANSEFAEARAVFQSIPNVITLVEQMRASGDPAFANALSRLRERQCTPADVDMFNQQRVPDLGHHSVISAVDNGAIIIVKDNIKREELSRVAVRRMVNRASLSRRVQLLSFAAHDERCADMATRQDSIANVGDVAAVRVRRRRVPPRVLDEPMRQFVATRPAASTGKLQSHFYYFAGMPGVIVDNSASGPRSVQLGIANGSTGRFVGVVHDQLPLANVVGDSSIRYAAPPKCVLFLLDSALNKTTGMYRQLVDGFPPGVVGLFPIKSGPFAVSVASLNPARGKRTQIAAEAFLW